MEWEDDFRRRMRRFVENHPGDGVPVSIKFRISSGCFHREHSPLAFALIDEAMANFGPDIGPAEFVEHETGPELLVRLGLVTAGITFATALVQLLMAVLRARSEGIAKGDQPDKPVEVIIRRINEGDRFEETIIVRKSCQDSLNSDEIKAHLEAALANHQQNRAVPKSVQAKNRTNKKIRTR